MISTMFLGCQYGVHGVILPSQYDWIKSDGLQTSCADRHNVVEDSSISLAVGEYGLSPSSPAMLMERLLCMERNHQRLLLNSLTPKPSVSVG